MRRATRLTRTAVASLLVAAGAAGATAVAPRPATAAPGLATPSPANGPGSDDAPVSVIVRATPGDVAGVEAMVRAVGGRVDRELALIDGFAATIPSSARAALAAASDVVSVSDDPTMQPLGTDYTSLLGYDPVNDTGSLYAINRIVGAQKLWGNGNTGRGVGVAVIDTGITPVAGLTGAGHVVNGPDLSFDSQSDSTRYLDGFGHGTMMASIIGGNDVWGCSALTNSTCAQAYKDPANFLGIAPDARLVNVKVGAADGAADVSQVIAAIDWVVQHRNDNGINIRVINLSYGTRSLQSYVVDPLAFAVEQAWKQGIVVVAAAGNDGDKTVESLSDPAYDPHIIAVGADDPMGTYSISDDVVPDFASHGTATRPVDVIAPGAHVVGLRVPGSFVDTHLSPGPTGVRFQRGSGTSESTAVVSGLVALMLQQSPTMTPDDVRARLIRNARLLDPSNANPNWTKTTYNRLLLTQYEGAGIVNAAGDNAGPVPSFLTTQPWSTGLGSLEASRGGVHVLDDTGVAVSGETDIFGHAWNSLAMAYLEALGSTWRGGAWNGSTWTGSTWTGSSWSGSRWDTSRWSSSRWSGSTWNGSSWSGSSWSGSSWR